MLIFRIPCKLNVPILLIVLLTTGCSDGNDGLLYKCNNKLLNESLSPKEGFTSQSYERDCGATTDFSTIVVIRKNNRSSQQGEPTLIAAAKGRISVDVKWISESQITIKSPGAFVNKKTRFENIEITYDKYE